MPHDSSPPTVMEASELAPAPFAERLAERPRRFVLALADDIDDDDVESSATPLGCRDVHGFREAVLAALEPRAPAPSRLALVAPEAATIAWLELWAEDAERVRRRITVRRADGTAVTVIATIASFGAGVAPSLAVESVRAPWGGAIHRSGVHSRAELEAALAHYDSVYDGGAETPAYPPGPSADRPAEIRGAETRGYDGGAEAPPYPPIYD